MLLAVIGMSPAVLTETLWALAHESHPVIPSRVVVLTTSTGHEAIRRLLFKPAKHLHGRLPWDCLRAALEAEGHNLSGRLRFGTTADDIRVITAADPATGRSRELADLRTPADNEAAADFLLEQVRAVVENPDTPLIASIAGGRKTMGALLYACMTLVGRETDRLTHVLVNEPFDTLPNFWFPQQPGGLIPASKHGRAQAAADPAGARVDLASVPFVPLRNLFTRDLGRKAGRFGALLESCRQEVRRRAGENIRLMVEQSRLQLDINGTCVKPAPREHLVLLFLATRAKQRQPAFSSYQEALDPLNAFRNELRAAAPPRELSDWRHGESLKVSFDDDTVELRRALSSLRKKIVNAAGNAAILVQCLPQRGRFSLKMPASSIRLND